MPLSRPLTDSTALPALLATAPSQPQSFSELPVVKEEVQALLQLAARAPSGTNSQPWQLAVVSGAAMARLRSSAQAYAQLLAQDGAARQQFWQRYGTHPHSEQWQSAHPAACAEAWLQAVIPANAGDARGQAVSADALQDYFSCAAAPLAIFVFVHQQLGLGAVLDVGMFVQNLCVAARARGLQALVQTGWRGLPVQAWQAHVSPPDASFLLAVVALGHVRGEIVRGPQSPLAAKQDSQAHMVWHN